MKEKFENHNLISQVRKEFEELKRFNLEKKARGEKYDPHFNDLLPEMLGEEEAALWRDFKLAQSEDELDKLSERLRERAEKITREWIEKHKERNLEAMIEDPKQAFVAFLGNQITSKKLEIYKKKKFKK